MANPDLEPTENKARQLEALDDLARRFGASMSNAFDKSAGDGKKLDDTLKTLQRSLAGITANAVKAPLQKLATQAFTGLFQNGLGAGGLGSSFVSPSFAFAKGGVVSGGMVQPFASGGVVSAPSYFPMSGGLGLMGEQGAEAILPLGRGADGKLGVRTQGHASPLSITLNVSTPDADSFRRSEAQVTAALARAVSRGKRGL